MRHGICYFGRSCAATLQFRVPTVSLKPSTYQSLGLPNCLFNTVAPTLILWGYHYHSFEQYVWPSEASQILKSWLLAIKPVPTGKIGHRNCNIPYNFLQIRCLAHSIFANRLWCICGTILVFHDICVAYL